MDKRIFIFYNYILPNFQIYSREIIIIPAIQKKLHAINILIQFIDN